MKNPSDKNKPKNKNIDKYTATEVGTLIEQFKGEFSVFGERQEAIIKKLDATYEQVAKNTEDVTILKIQVAKNTEKLTLLEIAVKNLVDKIEKLTKSIDELVKTKVSREELQTLEKRVSALNLK